MSAISGIGNAAHLPVTVTGSPGGTSREEVRESPAEKAREQRSPTPKANTAPSPQRVGGNASKASTNDQNRLRMLASQHLPVSKIAQRLGKSVSTIMSEAVSMGINLNVASSGTSSTENSGNPGTGTNVSVKI